MPTTIASTSRRLSHRNRAGAHRATGDRQVVGDLGVDRLQLTGVARAVAAEQAALAAGGPAAQLGRGPDQQRLQLGVGRVGGGRLLGDDVGDDAGDVVGAAGLQAGADQLDRGEVGGAHREDVGEAAVVEDAGGAVAAEQQPVAVGELDHEQVGVGLLHAVERLEDEVAVGVDPRLLLADPALVDQRLHERVVLGELGQLAVAEEVGPAVPDVADADAGPVEEGHGGGGAGAVEGRVGVDEPADADVGLVQRPGHPVEQPGPGVVGGRVVELAQLLDGGRRRDIAAGRATHAVADAQQPRPGVTGVLVVLADPADIGDRRVVEAEAHLRSSRIVLPIRTWVPRVMVVGWVMRTVPM
jgi:hypothetical protein